MSDKKSRKHLIVPIFIPNQGCPHRCIFCQQEKITGQDNKPIDGSFVEGVLSRAVKSAGFETQINPQVAFYGGTFTNLPEEKMAELLGAVKPYLKRGCFRSIRVSTRPDAIDRTGLDLMKSLGVETVELGTQSMDDGVLTLARRGHRAEDTVKSVRMLRQHGFEVGIQLMPGLPGDSEEKFMKSVEKVVEMGPDMVRLYPAVVIEGTSLATLYREGRYTPLGLDEAVRICHESCVRLEENGIPVIRIGLMSTPSLRKEAQIVAGPWHDAFGFLVRSRIHQQRIEAYLPAKGEAERIRLRAPQREIPLIRGHKNLGLRIIEQLTGAKVTGVVPDGTVPSGQVMVDTL